MRERTGEVRRARSEGPQHRASSNSHIAMSLSPDASTSVDTQAI